MNASAVLSRISWFVVSFEDNRATMATYYAESIELRADLTDMAITNRFARGVVPQIEARMDEDAAAAGRRPAAFDLVAAELAWVFTLGGRRAFADRMRPVWWETTLPVQDADKRACLLALRCDKEALEKQIPGVCSASRCASGRDDDRRAFAERVSRLSKGNDWREVRMGSTEVRP
jgi:hypothetical protein